MHKRAISNFSIAPLTALPAVMTPDIWIRSRASASSLRCLPVLHVKRLAFIRAEYARWSIAGWSKNRSSKPTETGE